MSYELRNVLLSSLLAAASPTLSFAQNEPPAAEAKQPEASAETWIRQLGDESYKKRLEAERRLRELGEQALPALKKAAEAAGDGETQWRARRLLRQIESGVGPGLVERRRGDDAPQEPLPRGLRRDEAGGLPDGDTMRRQFDRLFQRFERDFGVDVPRMRFFEDEFFRDLEAQLQRGGASSQGMTVQIGPDGVRVEVQEKNEKGELEKKVYEAPDMETFQQQYPDVLRNNGLGLGLNPLGGQLRGRFGPLLREFDWNDARPRILPFDQAPPGIDAPVAPPSGRRLGVAVKDVPAGVREYLELDEGTGLMVESVQPGSLAEALGLESNDIVVEIGGRSIGSPADVAEALGAIRKGGVVVVQFVRKGRMQRAEAEKREDAMPVRAPLPKRAEAQDGSIR